VEDSNNSSLPSPSHPFEPASIIYRQCFNHTQAWMTSRTCPTSAPPWRRASACTRSPPSSSGAPWRPIRCRPGWAGTLRCVWPGF